VNILDRLRRALGRDPNAPARLPDPTALIVVARPESEPEALMLQEMLRNDGVHSAVRNRDAGSATYGTSGPAWGYELVVLRRDLRRAREILSLPEDDA
jgi:hypothetical protein